MANASAIACKPSCYTANVLQPWTFGKCLSQNLQGVVMPCIRPPLILGECFNQNLQGFALPCSLQPGVAGIDARFLHSLSGQICCLKCSKNCPSSPGAPTVDAPGEPGQLSPFLDLGVGTQKKFSAKQQSPLGDIMTTTDQSQVHGVRLPMDLGVGTRPESQVHGVRLPTDLGLTSVARPTFKEKRFLQNN